ncbi:hypothetical protein NL676_005425 [Syzygium grande]|nr:hypothetical protein NL676_005425 [Syzygium grande]
MIEEKVAEAKEVCEGEAATSVECWVAWDEVEEVSQAKAHLRLKLQSCGLQSPPALLDEPLQRLPGCDGLQIGLSQMFD